MENETTSQFNVDIAVLTSIPVEIIATLNVFFPNFESQENFSSYILTSDANYLETGVEPTVYHYGRIYINNKSYSIIIVKPCSYGGEMMSSIVTNIINQWKPHYYFLIGIAMSFDDKIATLGDVVLCDKIIAIRSERIGPNTIEKKPNNNQFDKPFHDLVFRSNTGKLYFSSQYEGKSKNYNKKVVVGTYFSSNNLIASTSYKKELKAYYRAKGNKLLAGEMEATGIINGAIACDPTIIERLLIAKGISDFGDDNKKDTKWRYLAAKASATFVYNFITKGELDSVNNDYYIDPKIFRKLSSYEYSNWLGEMQLSQGIFTDASSNFDRSWDVINGENNEEINQKMLIARIALNKSSIDLEKGRIDQSLNKTTIALLTYKGLYDRGINPIGVTKGLANSLFLLGKELREAELLRNCEEYFELSNDCYQNMKDSIGLCNVKRWEGYTKYKFGDFISAYRDIYNSLLLYNNIGEENRLVISEIFDMLGRCLREIINKYCDDQYEQKVRLPKKPKDRNSATIRTLYYFWQSKNYAEKEGNYFKMAECYLSYLILFSYSSIHDLLSDILKRKDFYISKLDEDKFIKSFDNSSEFINDLPEKYDDVINTYYKYGYDICKKQDYDLLSCLFLRYRGDYSFYTGHMTEGFNYYEQYYKLSLGNLRNDGKLIPSQSNIRPQEKYRSFSEINKLLYNINDQKTRNDYIKIIYNLLARDKLLDKTGLFNIDYFRALNN